MSAISRRKASHLELCIREDVESHGRTLLDEVHLFHEALPELSCSDVDSSVELLGRRLLAPVLISGMSGGTEQARELNRALASTAQKHGLGMGVGSQRAMLLDPTTAPTYRVRDVAPDILLFGNLGAVQARGAGPERVARLAEEIGADALCIHLNAAQELVQDEGDRDFRGCLEALRELAKALPMPIVVKETGCGFSPRTLERLRAAGIRWVDVSGAGGTTWTGVEALRGTPRQRALGAELREWGIPTAAAIVFARRAGLHTIASGGIRSAADAVRALALGAEAVSLALPFLRAYAEQGVSGALGAAGRLIESMRAMMLLTGARDVADLHRVPRRLGPALRAWIDGADDESLAGTVRSPRN
jgi:isopentenyl-diphosphate delta-isomerase